MGTLLFRLKGFVMTTPTSFTPEDYVRLNNLFSGGDISKASKRDLERFAVMLSRPRAYEHFGASSFAQVCETVRNLLIVRMSEEANREATRISQIALLVAMTAFGCAAVQLLLGVWSSYKS
jgi:hypothetical protein